MHYLRRHRSVRLLGATASLLLFLVGSQLCLVAALAAGHGASVPMGCMATGPKQAGAMNHCGHAAGAAPGSKRDARGTAPCCLSILPVSAPSIEKHAAAVPAAVPPAQIEAPDAPRLSSPRAAPPPGKSPPPAAPRAPLPARAPPLR